MVKALEKNVVQVQHMLADLKSVTLSVQPTTDIVVVGIK